MLYFFLEMQLPRIRSSRNMCHMLPGLQRKHWKVSKLPVVVRCTSKTGQTEWYWLLWSFFPRWKGIRDDLHFLLEEEFTDVNLCALHCEMRNTEQVLGSVGPMAYECNALQELNLKLSERGPGTFKDNYVKIKERKGQETCVDRNIVKVSSMSG